MRYMKVLVSAAAVLLCAAVAVADRPNVVIIYSDDVGIGDVGAYGAKLIPTPNIDRLAENGLMFWDGHCAAATCSPSRYALLTGEFAFRKGIYVLPGDAKLSISPDQFTIADLFKQAGYSTAVIGKWHLGLGDTDIDWNTDVKPGPLELGFDYSFIIPATPDRVPCVYLENHRVVNLDPADPIRISYDRAHPLTDTYPDGRVHPEAMTYYKSTHGHNNSVINGIGRIGYMSGGRSALWNDETMGDVLVDRARQYIVKNKDKPFFLYFASQYIHVPRAPNPRFRGKSKLTYRGDAMVELDWTTGAIMDTLKEYGLDENTIVIFTSDNGPVYDDGYDDGTTVYLFSKEVDRGHDASGVYRGGKYQIYEGGTRIPLIVHWPKHVKPGVSTALVSQVDFLSSFASFLGINLDDGDAPDSRNCMAALLGKDPKGSKFIVEETRSGRAVRQGPWKYINSRKSRKPGSSVRAELYNLDKDVAEKNNIVGQHPDRAEQMKKLLQQIENAKDGIRNNPF